MADEMYDDYFDYDKYLRGTAASEGWISGEEQDKKRAHLGDHKHGADVGDDNHDAPVCHSHP